MPEFSDETKYGPREAVADWLTANDIDPGDVPLPSVIVIKRDPVKGRSIHYTVVVRNDEGHIEYAPGRQGPKVESRTMPLKAEPPSNVLVSEVPSAAEPPVF